jgi:hypothetical protein
VTVRLLIGDCRERMAELPDASVDAVVCDPPYDLTNRVPDVKKCRDCGRVCGGRDGHPDTCPRCGGELYNQRSQGKGFMGKDWDGTGVAFNPETWIAVSRVLKPGGHLLACGGTRTFHRLTCAIEDAGFEIRDCLSWLYGSGFPKSLDVSKAIDAQALHGKSNSAGLRVINDTQQIGLKRYSQNGDDMMRRRGVEQGYKTDAAINRHGQRPETAPATDLARQWDGWGTALKPAWEPIILARKPLAGGGRKRVELTPELLDAWEAQRCDRV